MYMYTWFTSLYSRNQCNIAEQLNSIFKKQISYVMLICSLYPKIQPIGRSILIYNLIKMGLFYLELQHISERGSLCSDASALGSISQMPAFLDSSFCVLNSSVHQTASH